MGALCGDVVPMALAVPMALCVVPMALARIVLNGPVSHASGLELFIGLVGHPCPTRSSASVLGAFTGILRVLERGSEIMRARELYTGYPQAVDKLPTGYPQGPIIGHERPDTGRLKKWGRRFPVKASHDSQ